MSGYLLDTQILLWSVQNSPRLTDEMRSVISDGTPLNFSAVSIWEVAIKSALGRPDFDVSTAELRANLLSAELGELPFRGTHAIAVQRLPPLHRDPFDRALIAQAISESLTLLTADSQLSGYGESVRKL